MKKKRARGGEILILLGLVLLFVSGGLYIRQKLGAKKERVQMCSAVLQDLQKSLPAQTTASADSLLSDPDRLPVLEVKGIDCIGKIEIPEAGLSFPVGSRFLTGEKAVIPMVLSVGENGSCKIGMVSTGTGSVRDGDKVIFTDVRGRACRYVADLVTEDEKKADGELVIAFSGGLQTTYVSCIVE
jgi:hypothetical protein